MSRSYWRVLIAIILGLAVGVLSPPSDAARRNQSKVQTAADDDLERIAVALESLLHREHPDTGCHHGTENRRSDLCAQWKAADAAEQSADWTRRTFWLALAGTVIGGLTLGAAAYAAYYAKSAADAATKSLAHEVLISGLQLDSILHIESVNIEDGNGRGTQVNFVVRNVGTLPAKNLKINGAWGFRPDIDADPLILQHCTVPKGISPNGVVTVKLPASAQDVTGTAGHLFCQFEISWEDRGGNLRRISEIHQSDGTHFSFLRDY